MGQLLTGALLQLDSIAGAAPEHHDEIGEAKQAVRRALDEVRRISSELRPEMLEQLGLVSALTELTTTFGRVSGIRVERRFDPSLPQLEPRIVKPRAPPCSDAPLSRISERPELHA